MPEGCQLIYEARLHGLIDVISEIHVVEVFSLSKPASHFLYLYTRKAVSPTERCGGLFE